MRKERLLKLKPPASKPKVADCVKFFQGPWLDHLPSWGGSYQRVKPTDFCPPYARDTTFQIAISSLVLLCDNESEDIDPLLVGMVQLGIDYYHLSLAKNDLWRGGSGQGTGRKWPIIFAGLMLGNEAMQNVKGSFAEDDQTFYHDDASTSEMDPLGNLQRGVKGWTGATVLWAHFYTRDVDHEHLPPEEWHKIRIEGNKAESYMRIFATCNVGVALAARLMRAVKLWNHPAFFDFEDRWMSEVLTPEQNERLKHVKTRQQVNSRRFVSDENGGGGWPDPLKEDS